MMNAVETEPYESEVRDPDETLYVIAVISNPVRFDARDRLFEEFVERTERMPNVQLVIVEHAFGNRPFKMTQPNNRFHVQIRGDENHELWLKESLINIGVRYLPQNWKYMAWVDADIQFIRPDWAKETIHALQHYAVVQPWSHSLDLSPTQEIVENEWGNAVDKSFCAAWVDGDFKPSTEGYGEGSLRAPRSHYGYAWAIRREAYNAIGGLIDWLVTGSADYHMALAFAGLPFTAEGTPGYMRNLNVFADRCNRNIKKNIGYVPGTILHSWHGRKKQRGYISRFDVIKNSEFDPDIDLVRDWQGLPVLTGDNLILRDGLRKYFRSRNEDSIDTQ
jgi:hypothetical protein